MLEYKAESDEGRRLSAYWSVVGRIQDRDRRYGIRLSLNGFCVRLCGCLLVFGFGHLAFVGGRGVGAGLSFIFCHLFDGLDVEAGCTLRFTQANSRSVLD